MNTVSQIIGLNWVVIGPTLALVVTALVLLFCTITITTTDTTKKAVTITGILGTLFAVFLKFGLFLCQYLRSTLLLRLLNRAEGLCQGVP